MKRSFISWLIQVRAQIGLAAAVLAASASCQAPVSSERMPDLEKAEKVGVVSAALGPAPATYVVNASGSDGYCDGVLYAGDHATAIQTCIDNAFNNGGGTVLVTPGTYNTYGAAPYWTVDLKANVALRGQDRGVIFSPSASLTIVGIVGSRASISGISFALVPGSTIGVTFKVATEHVTIERNLFDATTGSPGSYSGIIGNVSGLAYNHLSILRNTFNQNAFASVSLAAIMLTTGGGWSFRVEGNHVLIRNISSSPFLRVDGFMIKSVVTGNHFDTYGGSLTDGIRIANPTDVVISNNLIRANNPVVFTGTGLCTAHFIGNTMSGKPDVGPCETASFGNNENGVVGTIGASPGRPAVLVRAHRSGNQTFTGGGDTQLIYNAETTDFGNNYDTSTGLFTAPRAGKYRVRACARFDGTNWVLGNVARMEMYRSGIGTAVAVNFVIAGPGGFSDCVDDIVSMGTGDTLSVYAGGTGIANTRTISGTGTYSTYLNIEQLSGA
jgi:hypothetical protein